MRGRPLMPDRYRDRRERSPPELARGARRIGHQSRAIHGPELGRIGLHGEPDLQGPLDHGDEVPHGPAAATPDVEHGLGPVVDGQPAQGLGGIVDIEVVPDRIDVAEPQDGSPGNLVQDVRDDMRVRFTWSVQVEHPGHEESDVRARAPCQVEQLLADELGEPIDVARALRAGLGVRLHRRRVDIPRRDEDQPPARRDGADRIEDALSADDVHTQRLHRVRGAVGDEMVSGEVVHDVR